MLTCRPKMMINRKKLTHSFILYLNPRRFLTSSTFMFQRYFFNREQLDPDNTPADEPHAKYILDLFLGEIQKQCDQLTEGKDFLQRLHFSEIATHFKVSFIVFFIGKFDRFYFFNTVWFDSIKFCKALGLVLDDAPDYLPPASPDCGFVLLRLPYAQYVSKHR